MFLRRANAAFPSGSADGNLMKSQAHRRLGAGIPAVVLIVFAIVAGNVYAQTGIFVEEVNRFLRPNLTYGNIGTYAPGIAAAPIGSGDLEALLIGGGFDAENRLHLIFNLYRRTNRYTRKIYVVSFDSNGQLLEAGELAAANAVGFLGIYFPGFGDNRNRVIVQEDGGLLLWGWLAKGSGYADVMIKLRPDRSLDTDFNGTGYLYFPNAFTDQDILWDVVTNSAGEIFYASSGCISGLTPGGTPSHRFGGARGITLDPNVYPSNLQVMADGDLMVSAVKVDPIDRTRRHIRLVRLDSNGDLEPSFGIGGQLDLNSYGSSSATVAMAEASDGNIIIGTSTRHTGTIYQLEADGSRDLSFGRHGKYRFSQGPLLNLQLGPNRQLYWTSGNNVFALDAHASSGGSLDPRVLLPKTIEAKLSGVIINQKPTSYDVAYPVMQSLFVPEILFPDR